MITSPSDMSMRLVVSTNRLVRRAVSRFSKIEKVTSSTPSTGRVLMPFWPITLSMICWISSGFISWNSCTNREATSTSIKARRFLRIAGKNHLRPKRAFGVVGRVRSSSTGRPLASSGCNRIIASVLRVTSPSRGAPSSNSPGRTA